MTVLDLINMLREKDPTAPVFFYCDHDSWFSAVTGIREEEEGCNYYTQIDKDVVIRGNPNI